MTAILIIIVLIINAAVAHIIGNVAKDRKIGYNTAFLLSFLLSPLLGILIVIASPLIEPGVVKTGTSKTQPDERPIYSDWKKINPDKKIWDFLEKYPNGKC